MLAGTALIGVCSHYQYLDRSADVLVYEYDSTVSQQMVACDLVIYTGSGEVFMHDFLLLNDGNWRNAYGEVAASLESLIPGNILASRLIKREKIEAFNVGGEIV
jgi:hypothetical protein